MRGYLADDIFLVHHPTFARPTSFSIAVLCELLSYAYPSAPYILFARNERRRVFPCIVQLLVGNFYLSLRSLTTLAQASASHMSTKTSFFKCCTVAYCFSGVWVASVSDNFSLYLCKYPPVAVLYCKASFGCAAFGRECSRAFLPERPWLGWVAALHSFRSVGTFGVSWTVLSWR